MTEYVETVKIEMTIPVSSQYRKGLTGKNALFDEDECLVKNGTDDLVTYIRVISADEAVDKLKAKYDIIGTSGNTIADLKYLLAVMDQDHLGAVSLKAHNSGAEIYARAHERADITRVSSIPNVITAISSHDRGRMSRAFMWLYLTFQKNDSSAAIAARDKNGTMAELAYRLKTMIYDAGSSYRALVA